MSRSLFDQNSVSEILLRINQLTPHHQRLWGRMEVSQMLAHCNLSMETAMGKNNIKRLFIGRLIGPFFKSSVIGDKPFGKNSPTDKSYIFTGKENLNFDEEKDRLEKSIHQFNKGGASACTTFPHPFFGKFTPGEWAIFQWKHLDHHLRQFGV